ncbi:MAG: hypothetical protein HY698_18120 [Deltaproteobacteria bacterium]|nr:hypothetical protein [Deltaproteobacteria bacterium]
MHMDGFLALVLRLAHGILAIQAPGTPVELPEAVAWATAAAFYAEQESVDPWELVAIARNETDFRPDLVGSDGLDCGIVQTRVKYSRYRCGQLRRDIWLAFAEGARELRENQQRCTKNARHDLTRCRINSYNSGVRYAKRGWAGRYWLRVTCFAEAARSGSPPGGDCRGVKSRRDIARLLALSPGKKVADNGAGPASRVQ